MKRKEEIETEQINCEKIEKTGIEYKCEKCDYKSKRHSNVTDHMRAKHEGEGFQCDECGYWSAYKHHMKRHILGVHKPDKLDDIWNAKDKSSRRIGAKIKESSEEVVVIDMIVKEEVKQELTSELNILERYKTNKPDKAINVTMNTGGINDHGYDIQIPSDLEQFVRKDPTDLKYYCTICISFYENSITRTRNHVESSHFPKKGS